MERESNPMEALCRSGCGFYGNPATDGLCSVCFKPARTLASRNDVMASNGTLQEALKKKQQPPASAASPVSAAAVFASPPATTVFASPPTPAPVAAAPTVSCHSAARATLATQAALDKLSEEAGSSGNSSSGSPGVDMDAEGDDKDSGKDKKKKNRCNVCRKKVGLTGFECRCGGLFCSVHRYSDKHECSFDYRELGAQEIRRNNPVVVGEKIHKI